MTTIPKVNILIRTSRRPKGFARLIESIKKQSYRNIEIIVCADDEESWQYATSFNEVDSVIRVVRNPKSGNSPHNLYLNELLKEVEEGFVIIIDDDDFIADRYVISKMVRKLQPEALNIVKMKWPNGREIPEPAFWTTPFVRKHIGMPCLVFDASLKDQVIFDANKAADFRVANKLASSNPVNFIDLVVVHTGNTGLNGKSIDIDD